MVFAIRDFLFLTDSPGEAKPLPVAGCLPSGLSLLFPAAGLGSGWDSLSHSLSVFEMEHSFYSMDLSYHSFGAKAIQLTKHAPGNSRGMSIFRDNRGSIPLTHSAFCAFRLSLAKFYLDNYLNIT